MCEVGIELCFEGLRFTTSTRTLCFQLVTGLDHLKSLSSVYIVFRDSFSAATISSTH